uniref:Uncharacterized protein n=1 Tax=Labrus bergylta TaxID=56723 RepID=A0A3Q3F6X6_9LABR
MSQDSQHGRWTVSSSDEDDEGLPPSGTSTSKPAPLLIPVTDPSVPQSGSGWALSDSDDEDVDLRRKSVGNPPKRAPPSPKTKKTKVENERPPSPHGRVYYIDEPDDFFETSLPSASDPYRFYLNKVTGLDRRFNTGALHIRDILSPLFGTLKESVQVSMDANLKRFHILFFIYTCSTADQHKSSYLFIHSNSFFFSSYFY